MPQGSWIRQYLRDHLLHFAVILFLALYPGIYYHLAHGAEGTGLWVLLLPGIDTMRSVMWLAVFAMSFDFISGYTGYLSFGHSMFFGTGVFFVLGGRAGAWGVFGEETPFMLLLVLAMILAFGMAFLLGLVSFRLTGVYFAMITLGFAEIGKLIVEGYIGDSGLQMPGDYHFGVPFIDALQLKFGNFNNGDAALHLHDVPILGDVLGLVGNLPVIAWVIDAEITVPTTVTAYFLLGLVAILAYFSMQRIVHSPFGRVMIAIRENEERAKAIGYNTFWYKNVAFAFSAAFAAVGGAMLAAQQKAGGVVHFDVIEMAGDALIATIIGGMGTLAGPLFGFLFDRNLGEIFGATGGSSELVAFLEETFPGLVEAGVAFEMTVGDYLGTVMSGHAQLYIGVVFVVFVLWVPGGFLGLLRARAGGSLSKAVPAWLERRR
ncbi:MAG: branched-chain amino acid ABC transporter permease [Haloarculaceae archaeon]